MEFTRSFTFPFKDKSWLSKLLIAGVVAMVPILNFALFGWMLEISRRVMRNEAEELPGWDDFGKKFMDGLYYFVASFVYALPIIVISCIFGVALTGVTGALSNASSAEDLAGIFATGSGLLITCFTCLVILYSLVLSVLLPGLMVHYAQDGNFGAYFKFGDVFAKVRENASTFFTAWIVSIAAGFVVSFALGIIGTLVGWIPCIGQIIVLLLAIASAPYISAIYAHLFGQYGAVAYGGELPAAV